ncbi:family 10 glycosylhydrolase [Escherichia coli]
MIDKLDHLQRRYKHGLFHAQAGLYCLWPSKILPWSDSMTGKIGENPGYDPSAIYARRSRQAWMQ